MFFTAILNHHILSNYTRRKRRKLAIRTFNYGVGEYKRVSREPARMWKPVRIDLSSIPTRGGRAIGINPENDDTPIRMRLLRRKPMWD